MNSLFLFRLQNYLRYRWHAVGPHSLHSPFLFDLYNNVIKPARKFRLANVEKLRLHLKSNHDVIDLFDLKTQTSYRKTISSIARTSLSTPKFSAFLYKLIDWMQLERVVETGTSLGINSLYLAGPELVQKVTTIEASPIIATIAEKQFDQLLQHKVEIKKGKLDDVLQPTLIKTQPQLCFLDADHRSEKVMLCLESILKHVPQVKCIVIHDIYWSSDMKIVWDKIVSDKRFTLTVDLFQAGIIFLGNQMPKQHFIIRF